MTQDGGDGAAADCQPGARPCGRVRGWQVIKRDDGGRVSRYIGFAYPHTPAGQLTKHPRCERQVATALRNHIPLAIVEHFHAAAPAEGGLRRLRRKR